MSRTAPPFLAAFALLALVAGCGKPMSPSAPARMALHVRWASPERARDFETVDSLSARVLDSGTGKSVAGPVPLGIQIISNQASFSGSLVVPAGNGLRAEVSAFARGTLFYRGLSGDLAVPAGGSTEAPVTLDAATSLIAAPSARSAHAGDSLWVNLDAVPGDTLRGAQADLTFDSELSFVPDPSVSAGALQGFSAVEVSPGRVRVVLYDATGQQRVPGGSRTTLCRLRFFACPSGCTGTSHLALEAVVMASTKRQELPVTLQGDSVAVAP